MLYLWTRKLITSSAFRNYLSQERSSIADNELDPTENKITKITKGVVTDHACTSIVVRCLLLT